MTDEVAALVLRHNYRQNMALAVARSQAPSLLHVHARYLRKLIRDKRLNTERDVLPNEREIAERRSSGGGLTNPELALLLAHTKIAAGEDVLTSSLPDDPYLRRVLDAYFPAPLQARFADRMEAHPLRRGDDQLRVVGVIDTDVSTGVAGRIGPKPDMLPMSVRVKTGRYADSRLYKVQMIREPVLLPSLLMSVLTSAIDTEGNLPEELTARLSAMFQLRDYVPITLSDTFSGPGYTGRPGRRPCSAR